MLLLSSSPSSTNEKNWKFIRMLLRDPRVVGVFIAWAILASLLSAYLFASSNAPCPVKQVWHGGHPNQKFGGSCWCGADTYCLCTPSLAIDAIIEMPGKEEDALVLVHRGAPPKGYAITGGFVDVGESVEQAAAREVKEETNLDLDEMKQWKVYSDPARDKRRHTVSVVFRCRAKAGSKVKVGDDAKAVVVIPLSQVLSLDLAFDHRAILTDYLREFHPNVAASASKRGEGKEKRVE